MQPLYPILDVEAAAAGGHDLVACARGFAALGLGMQQLRAKRLPDRAFLQLAEQLAAAVPQLIINDRSDIALLCGAAGVHVGQEDLPADGLRSLRQDWTVGTSTHSLEQARAALAANPDYLAVGPIYPTRTKPNPDPVVGLEMIASVRALTTHHAPPTPAVIAIGGIQLENCAAVWRAGADVVAVISGLWAARDPVSAARQFLLAFARV